MRLPGTSVGQRALRRRLVTIVRPQQRAFSAAVLGGGLTGLTAAWKLNQDPNCTSITLYEKSPRLGGWLQSESIPVDGGNVVFEYGPRTIRSAWPAAHSTIWLANQLGISDDLVLTRKDSPAAQNRFIYYPDHLVRLPAPRQGLSLLQNSTELVSTLMKEPLFESFVSGLIQECFNPARPPSEYAKDESISSFISRRFNSKIADNLVSAMMHGIYAGDIDKLSAQTLMGNFRNMEGDGIVRSMLSKVYSPQAELVVDEILASFCTSPRDKMPDDKTMDMRRGTSTFTFTDGMQRLPDALAASLRKSPKVTIKTNFEIQGLSQRKGSDDIQVYSNKQDSTESHNRVIASIPTPALVDMLSQCTNHPNQKPPPHSTINLMKSHNYATTVMVVNLYYSNPNLLKEEGFGYLIPRSVPFEENPDCALGVLFASASSKGVTFDLENEASQDTAAGTKLTLMFGGHYWDGWKEGDYPDHDTAIRMAQRTLQRHLGVTDTPKIARSRLQVNAIPQYTVGHMTRMFELSKSVKEDFNKRLVLAGNWYNGIGVNDCVRQGLMAATFGVGNKTGFRPVMGLDEWAIEDIEGGIPMAPVKYVVVSKRPPKGMPPGP